MREYDQTPRVPKPGERQPVFLLPHVITALIGIMVAIELAKTLVLNQQGQEQLLFWFAFLPTRLVAAAQDWSVALPLLWTPVTHALLHAGWEHLLLNMAWLAIFGTPVARRYGPMPMLGLFFVSAIAGAALFAATSLYGGAVLLGASGGIAGLTGAAVRFMFQPLLIAEDPETGRRLVLGRKLASLTEMWREPRARNFSLIWVVFNCAVPLLPLLTGTAIQVAWQAHLGGFFAGLLLVGLAERRLVKAQ